ncbi:MAG: hypothetical protein EOP53_11375 [Sphingobacteriales bacterium]|nr:MAG: hypothetical protein EOP53_11375 [Sphingobacteriales bacterium]
MNIGAIKTLVDTHDLFTLQQLQNELEEEKTLTHDVPGEDEGEKLTHLLGAIWIKEKMFENATDYKTELRNFTSRVRGSIS